MSIQKIMVSVCCVLLFGCQTAPKKLTPEEQALLQEKETGGLSRVGIVTDKSRFANPDKQYGGLNLVGIRYIKAPVRRKATRSIVAPTPVSSEVIAEEDDNSAAVLASAASTSIDNKHPDLSGIMDKEIIEEPTTVDSEKPSVNTAEKPTVPALDMKLATTIPAKHEQSTDKNVTDEGLVEVVSPNIQGLDLAEPIPALVDNTEPTLDGASTDSTIAKSATVEEESDPATPEEKAFLLYKTDQLAEAYTAFLEVKSPTVEATEVVRGLKKVLIDDPYVKGVDLYQRQHLNRAIEKFDQVLFVEPSHTQALVYKSRCEKLLERLNKL